MWKAEKNVSHLITLYRSADDAGPSHRPPKKRKMMEPKPVKVLFFDNDFRNFKDDHPTRMNAFINSHLVFDCQQAKDTHTNCLEKFCGDFDREIKSGSEFNKFVIHHFLKFTGWLKEDLLKSDAGEEATNIYYEYLDGYSGLQVDPSFFKVHDVHKDDIFVFDWDRTITKCEGFLGRDLNGDAYIKHLECEIPLLFEDNDTDRLRTHLRVLCGGSWRYHNICAVLGQIPPENLYILTNNPSLHLIQDCARLLHPSMIMNHVVSMHYIVPQLDTKMDYIKRFIVSRLE